MAYTADKQKTAAKKDSNTILNQLYKEFDLTIADVYSHKHYNLITRSGIEKIIAKSNIQYDMDLASGDVDHAIMKGRFEHADKGVAITFASAHNGNCTSDYYAEMAEKRCMSRGVLKLLGLYALGFFGDDEFDTKTMSESDAKEFKANRRTIYTNGESRSKTSFTGAKS